MSVRVYTSVAIAFGLICFITYGGLAWFGWVIATAFYGHWVAAGCIAVVGLTALAIAWQAVTGVLAWGER